MWRGSIVAAASAVAAQWNVFLFIAGLMGLAAAAEESGAFAWIAAVLLERGRGSRRRLFVLLFLTGAALTLVLSNDATAIVLTPLIYSALARHDRDPMPYLLACTFVADTASFGLPFANPANVLILPRAALVSYVAHLGVPQIVAIAINLGIFLVVFRARLRGEYAFETAPHPAAAARRALVAMGAVGIAYVAALWLRWPLGPVAFVGATATLAVAAVPLRATARHVGWGAFALLAVLFAVLDVFERAGVVRDGAAALTHLAAFGPFVVDAVAACSAAVLSNAVNNLPVAAASSYFVAHVPTEHLAYPLIAGVDVGPNLTLAGSLSTILWFSALRKRGVQVNPWEYFRIGVLVVPPILAVTIAWLWMMP